MPSVPVFGFQLTPSRGWKLLVSRAGTGASLKRSSPPAVATTWSFSSTSESGEVAGQLVPQAVAQRQVRRHAPLVLREEVDVAPVVVDDLRPAGQRLVDLRHVRHVVHVALQRGVLQAAAERRVEEAVDVAGPEVHAELRRMVAGGPGEVVLDLQQAVLAPLRQVQRQADGRAGGRRVEAEQPELVDLDGRDLLGREVRGRGLGVEIRVRRRGTRSRACCSGCRSTRSRTTCDRDGDHRRHPGGVTWPPPVVMLSLKR